MTRTSDARGAIRAVTFDMDGTLCLPQPWMFPAMRDAIGCTDTKIDILTFIDALPTVQEKRKAEKAIHDVEVKAMHEMVPQSGLTELLQYLTENGVYKSICTRNIQTPVDSFIRRFVPAELSQFDLIVTRDLDPQRPNPDPLHHIASQLGVDTAEMMMVGDSFDDMRSGRSAGCVTVLLKNKINEHLLTEHADLVDVTVDTLAEIVPLLQHSAAESPAPV
ncbi:putative haloacid dehalogenase-like hydrolase KNAG_0B04090 [Huiozyma naganishii CBS 8797]|uniref:HAD superfamily hydrolase n=1 Tax=Huiozyma naganishii (strain ATCC MYA-139 / BCRC 22969 / CBS 8797 / KCTC 17520 / NBRC 10181 / NCYC 3082 / Yp74L-3) TaxID=1071383 RepID=J7S4W5_HUIN7|nr:hypothetical protein KNAG_0B04090 [Kazachstania naganishii CBS 8797]CCK68846.1 hypothetical protein KNAG_0B04090 [Kazachstania naganishii CBS 8797]